MKAQIEHTTALIRERLTPGQTYLGVLDGGDCVEIVFSRGRYNLITVYLDGRVEIGGVVEPEIYVRQGGDAWINAALEAAEREE